AEKSGGLRSYGIGLTKLRKFAKSIKRDAKLARDLWDSDVYEMKIISLLVDDPKTFTIERAETQVEQLHGGYLEHVFSTCDATLAKTPFVVELAERWIGSKDPVRRRCGYGLVYEISKDKRKSAPDEEYFLKHIERIEKSYAKEPTAVLMAMAGALQGIGMRSKSLNARALKLALKIGPIEFDPTGKCDPFDVAKNLTSDYAKKKFGL
ncbi:MAG: hypothetical protein HKN17_09480, partial [Rhodothermales bacterium]|nr:hypothetical protein [Rhodothermales bacterium]